MATATQTKPQQSTAPASKPQTTGTAAKGDATPAPRSVTRIISDPGMVLDGVKITVEDDPVPTEQVLDGPAVSDTNTEPLLDTKPQVTTTLGFFNEDAPTLPEGKYGFRPLTKSEMDELETHEAVVREGIPKFLAVGQALLQIREKKLWRLYCRSFKEYLDKRVGISVPYASMQVSAAAVMQNLLTSGEQIEPPTTERQLRPLASLQAKDQVAVWSRAVEKSAGRKVTGKAVEESIVEVLGDEISPQDWLTGVRNKLVAAGFETDFLQPVDLGEKTWIDLFNEQTNVFVKLIDQPTLANLATCLAMRERGVTYQVVVNSGSIPKKKLEKGRNNTLVRLLDPVLSVYLHSLKALVEYDGKLFEAGELGDDFKLALKPSESAEANDLRSALEPQKTTHTEEE